MNTSGVMDFAIDTGDQALHHSLARTEEVSRHGEADRLDRHHLHRCLHLFLGRLDHVLIPALHRSRIDKFRAAKSSLFLNRESLPPMTNSRTHLLTLYLQLLNLREHQTNDC